MRKINKIYIIILVLILCSACGRPHGLSAKTGRDVNCESELGNFSKYINLEKLSTTTDDTCKGQEVKVNNRKVGIFCGNMFTITSELTDFFTNYRMVNAVDTLEIPAGKLELNEDTAICALRELEEETGYSAKKISLISKFLPTPGYSDEWLYVYEAHDVYKVENPLECDEDEVIELIKMDIDTAYHKVVNGEIFDSKTMIAILHAYINKNKS